MGVRNPTSSSSGETVYLGRCKSVGGGEGGGVGVVGHVARVVTRTNGVAIGCRKEKQAECSKNNCNSILLMMHAKIARKFIQ